MNFLLTGETGFLGSIIKETLTAQSDCKVLSLNNKGRVDISYPFGIDISEPIDCVVHAAGKAHSVPVTKEEQEAFERVNFNGTIHLCNALEQSGSQPLAFIFISTVAVYGQYEGRLINEHHILKGESPYAISKINAEKFLRQWAKRNQISLFILRLPLVAGPAAPGNLGAMISAMKTGKYFGIKGNDAQKSMVWAEDVAKLIYRISDQIPGTYNLTDGYHPSFSELEMTVAKSLGRRLPKKIPLFIAQILGGIGDLVGKRFPVNSDKVHKITSTLTFDDSKARENLNWQPSVVLQKIDQMV